MARCNQLMKQKFLGDRETKIQIENELTKILIQDLEEARALIVDQKEQIIRLEGEVWTLSQEQ